MHVLPGSCQGVLPGHQPVLEEHVDWICRVEELIVAKMCANCRCAMWIAMTGRVEIGVPISNMVEEKPKA